MALSEHVWEHPFGGGAAGTKKGSHGKEPLRKLLGGERQIPPWPGELFTVQMLSGFGQENCIKDDPHYQNRHSFCMFIFEVLTYYMQNLCTGLVWQLSSHQTSFKLLYNLFYIFHKVIKNFSCKLFHLHSAIFFLLTIRIQWFWLIPYLLFTC